MACVSPSDTNAPETLSTLQYANRARNIKNAPTRNVDATALELQRLRHLNHVLKCELIKRTFAGVTQAGKEIEAVGKLDAGDFGLVDAELLKRDDVAAYLQQIDAKAAELNGGGLVANMPLSFPTHSVHSTAAASDTSLLAPAAACTNTNPIQLPSKRSAPSSMQNATEKHDNDDAMILDIDPEEDMQIIDQLLELQQQDKHFQTKQENDQDLLENMQGEIDQEEGHLLQLREHLKIYHNMKDKYHLLMCEVHSLESEKQALADELEKVQVNPTKGCSQAIKKKLQKIEESLARARSETRKHQQMYRQAEQEAQKCRVLERKIHDLKLAKVTLAKKQRENAAKHREWTNQKTREIGALKRREKNAEKKISKMETERRKFESNLERSRSRCDKLSEKLKQTESHLMRLLTKRRNDMSVNHSAKSAQRALSHSAASNPINLVGAPDNEEVRSIEFLLEKTVSDRVTLYQNRDAYESKVVEHGKLMQAMAKEANCMHKWKREYQAADPGRADEITVHISDHEENVQELQLQIELLENDLEQMQAKCPSIKDSVFGEDNVKETNAPVTKMISKLEGPVLRTLFGNLLDSFTKVELQRRTMKDTLGRKDSALLSFENEVSLLNKKIEALTKSLDRRRKLGAQDGQEYNLVDMIQRLEDEVQGTKAKLDSCLQDKIKLSSELDRMHTVLSESNLNRSQAEEKVALLRSQQKLTESTESSEPLLKQLQAVLSTTGTSIEDRHTVRLKLENCIEDACSRMLAEATALRDKKAQEVEFRSAWLAEMHAALGIEQSPLNSSLPLNDRLDDLQRRTLEIQPEYEIALDRYRGLLSDAETLTLDLHLARNKIGDNLQRLMNNQTQITRRKHTHRIPAHQQASMAASREARAKMMENVENLVKGLQSIDGKSSPIGKCWSDEAFALHQGSPPKHELQSSAHNCCQEHHSQQANGENSFSIESASLSTSFLDSCELEIKKLRLIKADRLLSNTQKCEQVRDVAKQMHIGSSELSSIVLHGLKKHNGALPSWWGESLARAVYSALFEKGTILANEAFIKHLNIILDITGAIASGRELLSDALKHVIEDSHSALLATAGGCGMDVNEMSRSLHDALFHLPSLSKQYVKACIDEMNVLVTAAESVSQSEIEILTFLWEGLNVSSDERGQFWGELSRSSSKIEMSTSSPFDNVLQECTSEVEGWVLKSTKEATKVQRMLRIKVFKLSKIHEEVERLKHKQDAKNGIMSLNNELKLLNAKLIDFEEKAGDKHRLLNKKVNSSSLLDEERFRKQMQGMFAAKLETLRQMLSEWEAKEGQIEDDNMLSEVVKDILQNSHRIDEWMNEKTRLMHLRTTNAKSRPRVTPKSNRTNTSVQASSSKPVKSRASIPASQQGTPHSSRHLSSAPTNQKSALKPRSTVTGHRSRQTKSPPGRPDNIRSQSKNLSKLGSTSLAHQKRKGLSLHNTPLLEKVIKHNSLTPSIEVTDSGSMELLPFGNLLAATPTEKENSHF